MTSKSPPSKRPLFSEAEKDKDTTQHHHDVISKKVKAKIKSTSSINHYAGWKVPSNNYTIPSISIGNDDVITPESFYNEFIRQRKPVVIHAVSGDTDKASSLLADLLSNLTKWKDVNYLKSQIHSNQKVMVEQRSSCSDDGTSPTSASFGNGHEVCMTFHNFVSLIDAGDDRHYLTTQDVHSDSNGRPDLMSPLMKHLRHDFPLRPLLMGNLIPQNINMWMGGNTNDGASSGLHHDYHDNLYIVLKGKKRFRLYSPYDTELMYTRGKLLTVHPNGRINYHGEETTAHGADMKSHLAARAAKRKEEAERMLIEAERAVEEGMVGAEQLLEAAEIELERAMDDIIDAEMDDDDDDDDDDDEKESVFETFGDERQRIVDKTVKDPNNFSKIKPNMLDDVDIIQKNYPDFPYATAAFCTVQEGDILYLPASWFHEVTSYAGENGNFHLAMNYWFHPPDGGSFEHPYSTDFWPNDYKDRFGK
jgi:hypothetical protein